jgi:Tfp pilus assembly protein PilV
MHIKNLNKILNQKGIGLIEVIASFAITMVVITALVALSLYSVRSSLNSKLLLEGTKVATREIERVRGFRDASLSWQEFTTGVSTTVDCTCAAAPCNKQCYMATGPLAPVAGETVEVIDNQRVTRYFNITQDASDPNNIVRVTVYVLWSVGGQGKSTNVYTDLTNWQLK